MSSPKPRNTFESASRDLAKLAPDEDGRWSEIQVGPCRVPVLTQEFWTSKQRQASNLHEISYRACYKPQLPRLFITHLTEPGDLVYDPFGGRGTTVLEAALLGRRVANNDINPLSRILVEGRLRPPAPGAVETRLSEIPKEGAPGDDLALDMFYHPDTERELRALRHWLLERAATGAEDDLDRWIRAVATNRLTGHSPGFFSVYTLPPNQAASAEKQRQINIKRNQIPPYRDTHAILLKKSRQLQKGLTEEELQNLAAIAPSARFLTSDARSTHELEAGKVALTVTSPPFLDVVQYATDNWLRCWFNGLDAPAIAAGITMARKLSDWRDVMGGVLQELHRVTRQGGHVAFEVGEVRGGSIRLEETILPLGLAVGFQPVGVLVNEQTFTKTAHIWGVDNMEDGTNSNRIVLFRK